MKSILLPPTVKLMQTAPLLAIVLPHPTLITSFFILEIKLTCFFLIKTMIDIAAKDAELTWTQSFPFSALALFLFLLSESLRYFFTILFNYSLPGRNRLAAIGRTASWVPNTMISWSMLSFWIRSSKTSGVVGHPPAMLNVTANILSSLSYFWGISTVLIIWSTVLIVVKFVTLADLCLLMLNDFLKLKAKFAAAATFYIFLFIAATLVWNSRCFLAQQNSGGRLTLPYPKYLSLELSSILICFMASYMSISTRSVYSSCSTITDSSSVLPTLIAILLLLNILVIELSKEPASLLSFSFFGIGDKVTSFIFLFRESISS